MIQIVNGLEMSLAKQYFEDSGVSMKQKDCNFFKTEKNSDHSKHMKEFLINRGSNIFSIRSDSFLIERFC